MIHGKGAFYRSNGEVISGEWNLNQFTEKQIEEEVYEVE
jgi:hypothetical protein